MRLIPTLLFLGCATLVAAEKVEVTTAPMCGMSCGSTLAISYGAPAAAPTYVLASSGKVADGKNDSDTTAKPVASEDAMKGNLKSPSGTPLPQATIIFFTKNADGSLKEVARVVTDNGGNFSTELLKPGTEYVAENRWMKSRKKGFLFFRKHERVEMKNELGTVTPAKGEELKLVRPATSDAVPVEKSEKSGKSAKKD